MAPPAKPQVRSFTASPATVQQGVATTLSWSSVNGRSAKLEGVDCALTGDMVVKPEATKVYELVVSGKGPDATAQVTVTVVQIVAPTPPATIEAEVTDLLTMTDAVAVKQ